MNLLYIDLFCGAGGTSTGVENAQHSHEQCAKVIACVNHDANAIASHTANHPDAMHFTEDIRTLELSPLVTHVNSMRKLHPDALIVLWASLECTNFSKAKGGQPRDADSRTLAEHLFRYIEAINPEYIQIENVEEFMSWGDLDENGKPISRDAGRSYRLWVDHVRSHGYEYDYRILNSADFGAYTARKRFFGIFAKGTLPIIFPEPTHAKIPKADLFKKLLPYKPVRDVLNFDDEGTSIFGRKKPLVEATLERIYAGLIKFVAGGKDAFLLKYNSMNQRRKYVAPGVDAPCPTVSTQGRLNLVKACFLSRYNSGSPDDKNLSVNQPCGVITTHNRFAPVQVFLSKYYSGNPSNMVSDVNAPSPTIRTKDGLSFISAYYGNGHNHSINEPAPTLTTRDRLAFVDMSYGNGYSTDINSPAATLTTKPKHQLVMCKPWIMNTNFRNIGSNIDSSLSVITANRKWHYLMNPQFSSAGGDINNPCFTLIARMDKMPPYLMEAQSGINQIVILTTDSPIMIKIKEFMIMYGIVDIKMRMLKIPELKQIMGFPKDYILIGTQAEQKKFIGNAVEVTMAKVMCEALVKRIIELGIKPLHFAA